MRFLSRLTFRLKNRDRSRFLLSILESEWQSTKKSTFQKSTYQQLRRNPTGSLPRTATVFRNDEIHSSRHRPSTQRLYGHGLPTHVIDDAAMGEVSDDGHGDRDVDPKERHLALCGRRDEATRWVLGGQRYVRARTFTTWYVLYALSKNFYEIFYATARYVDFHFSLFTFHFLGSNPDNLIQPFM